MLAQTNQCVNIFLFFSFLLQAADYVANAIYSKYEYNNDIYSNLLNSKINIVQHFPYKNFGK